MNKGKVKYLADISLIIVALVWGSGFIATEYALKSDASPTLILACRFMIAALFLLIVFFKDVKKINLADLKYGSVAGLLLFIAFYAQTVGQSLTVISNAAFITATNVAMVPFIVWAFTKEKPELKNFILSFTALCGIGILTISVDEGGIVLGAGDLLVLLSAFLFAMHIAYLGMVVKNRSPKVIAFVQLLVAGLIASAQLVVFDFSAFHTVDFSAGLIPMLYLGIFSTCICFLLQTTAQKYTTPSKTAIILSTEGFFGSLFSVILGLEGLTFNLVFGGTIVLVSVILIEVKWKGKKVKTAVSN